MSVHYCTSLPCHICNPPVQATVVQMPSTPHCDHCHCKRTYVDGRPHRVCCMCGNRQLTTTYGWVM